MAFFDVKFFFRLNRFFLYYIVKQQRQKPI